MRIKRTAEGILAVRPGEGDTRHNELTIEWRCVIMNDFNVISHDTIQKDAGNYIEGTFDT